ncbi:MAG TPA: hypothetical protein VGS61_04885 [Acidimicrobiales bacterium]|nr:hypothetical protein [Acidimicrobiales bacterium]
MRRKTLDLLLNWLGAILTVAFLVAGVGMLVGHDFTASQVRHQLAEQKVYFPAKGTMDYHDLVTANRTSLAGQEVLTGSQAEIFADDIIAPDTAAIAGGKTYSQLSRASLADPSNSALATQVQLVFRGDTLRGLLLNAYAFGFIGTIALFGAVAAFAAALIMLVLTLLGVRHHRQADPSEIV